MPEKPPLLSRSTTRRGPKIAQFHDRTGKLCALRLGISAIDLGIGDYDNPVWLTQEQVAELLPLMNRFVETGTI